MSKFADSPSFRPASRSDSPSLLLTADHDPDTPARPDRATHRAAPLEVLARATLAMESGRAAVESGLARPADLNPGGLAFGAACRRLRTRTLLIQSRTAGARDPDNLPD